MFDIFRREFDAAYAEGGLFQLTMHPHVISARSRIWILEELVRHAQSKDVWFATHAEVADWARARCPLDPPDCSASLTHPALCRPGWVRANSTESAGR